MSIHTTIALGEREDARRWERITREMQRFSRTIPGKEAIPEEERVAAAAYLAFVLGEDDDADRCEEGGRPARRLPGILPGSRHTMRRAGCPPRAGETPALLSIGLRTDDFSARGSL